ncbi:fasciclin domain-containing protein [Nocardia cyriacigeorgica]|uniref:fasciclin domain-containing protein n=1 Tax=Nocardia cyriacigeorgica TaxID=135487 RepID=UPI001894F068|nr:fasciclin domain-containing protein [Nocardia cyriacigeorgica]MBF6435212.1 fasciclin domain-containing protein [Nocardia cyriacigeorgica]MBF6454722.1 fasciclin domain-containing protein [Nocardia cyriacigeorgica]MBF6480969.1 fasciclin domain-containing protein [Nocardia cyriacigeorgica]MBF6552616.1 fasciclin domain-containing protein [Nocardia cyriacigeorgica]
MRTTRAALATALLAFAVTAAAGCTDDESDSSSPATTTEAMQTTMTPGTSMPAGDPAAGLVGPGCASYAEQVPSGPGSVQGMAAEPVGVAAANNPLLTQLTAAVSGQLNPQVNLVDTLNSGEFTIFAPVDEAFAAVDPATIETLKTDAQLLTTVLTYHAVPGRLSPDEVAGTHKTVQGAEVTVTRSGEDIQVGDAAVICGGVQTENATVYLIDAVLMPPTN